MLVKQKHVVLRCCWSWWWMACVGRWSVVINAAWRCRCRFYLDSQLHCRQLHQPRCIIYSTSIWLCPCTFDVLHFRKTLWHADFFYIFKLLRITHSTPSFPLVLWHWKEGHLACKNLGVGLLVVSIVLWHCGLGDSQGIWRSDTSSPQTFFFGGPGLM